MKCESTVSNIFDTGRRRINCIGQAPGNRRALFIVPPFILAIVTIDHLSFHIEDSIAK